ncbi:hypothetical protein ACFPYI_13245 [Halomarina salina]|uniref:DUF7974 domain-containing protein n=1 Tax=Halomarina salina TaxID=1872699 RepID=A0ABD5RPV8_9EURY|nr:hypothetical protein [Halomarina salina]
MPPGPHDTTRDSQGFDESRNVVTDVLGKFVPQWLARRAISVRVETDRETYRVGDPVEVTVTLRNGLPLPVTIATPRPRLWGWSVDGDLEASDEQVYTGDAPGTLSFRAGERKVISHTWDGRFKRVGDPTRWVEPEPGEHEVRAFLALDGDRPADAVTIRFEE